MDLTPEQEQALTALSIEYGQPQRVSVAEYMHWPLLWIRWFERIEHPARNLFVLPNGERLQWRHQ